MKLYWVLLLSTFTVAQVHASHRSGFGAFKPISGGLERYKDSKDYGDFQSKSGESNTYETKAYENSWKDRRQSNNFGGMKSYSGSRGYGVYNRGYRHRPRSRRGHRLSRPGMSRIKTTTEPCKFSSKTSPTESTTVFLLPSAIPTTGDSKINQ